MICYRLICPRDHEFEAWFSSSADYDAQAAARQIACPYCNSRKIDKAIMAPHVASSRPRDSEDAKSAMDEVASQIRREIENECDYVGDKFAEEARAIHYSEKPKRGIYGQASPKEAADLKAEGVDVTPLPPMLTPHKKKSH